MPITGAQSIVSSGFLGGAGAGGNVLPRQNRPSLGNGNGVRGPSGNGGRELSVQTNLTAREVVKATESITSSGGQVVLEVLTKCHTGGGELSTLLVGESHRFAAEGGESHMRYWQ